jgi:hypothetical protein
MIGQLGQQLLYGLWYLSQPTTCTLRQLNDSPKNCLQPCLYKYDRHVYIIFLLQVMSSSATSPILTIRASYFC